MIFITRTSPRTSVLSRPQVTMPARAPARVVLASPSEDQSLCWSPNGKWIVMHSHKDLSDDLWLQPADGSAEPKLLTHFGRGSETDWPRWSSDGKWVLVAAYKHGETPLRHVLYLIGVDQSTGAVARSPQEIPLEGFAGEITHAEWVSGSDSIGLSGLSRAQSADLLRCAPGGWPPNAWSFTSRATSMLRGSACRRTALGSLTWLPRAMGIAIISRSAGGH